MTASELRAALAYLDLTQMALARLLAVQPSTVRRWIAGRVPIPRAVALLLAAWAAHPDLLRAA